MWPDQWLIQKFIKFFFWRYGRVLNTEAHKWIDIYEKAIILKQVNSLAACGIDINIRPGARILAPENVHFGNHIGIGYNSLLRGQGGITLGNFVLLGDHVILTTTQHPVNNLHYGQPQFAPVVLKDNVWLGASVLVMSGVTIGKNSIIGGGAVVTKDIPPDSVAVGVPARVIKTITIDDTVLSELKASFDRQRTKKMGELRTF